jgi:ABC-type sugar transport system permease subunit
MVEKRRKKSLVKDDKIFYWLMMFFPILQFVLFYIVVKGNAILFAFQEYDGLTGDITWTLEYVKNAFKLMTQEASMITMLKTTIKSYFIVLAIGTPLGLLFSFYISKKYVGSGFFRIMLFVPSIVSAVILATIFQIFVERAVPAYIEEFFHKQIPGLLEETETRFPTLMFYNIWVGFGVSVLMFSDSIGNISPEIIEASHIDGVNSLQEFWYVTMPHVYPTLTTFLITGVAGLFTNQYQLFTLYGAKEAPSMLWTYGFYFFNKTQAATSRAEYPLLSAMGLWMTVVCLPLTLLVKFALEKYGPKEE